MTETKTSFLHRLDDEDTLSVPINPPKPVRALDLLVETCVETAFGRRALAMFERDSGLAVVVEVAGATWVSAVADVIERRMPRSRVVQVTGSPKR